jgi:transposase, IS5 family
MSTRVTAVMTPRTRAASSSRDKSAASSASSNGELRRRSAIEPVIGHLKAEGHLGRCYLKGRAGDAANAILSAVGYNFRRILAWLRALLRLFLIAILRISISRSTLIPAS